MSLSRAELGDAMLVVAVSPALYSAFGPSVFTMREFAGGDEQKADIRFAEIAGGALTIVTGFALAAMSPGPWEWAPVVASVIMVGMMTVVYEYALSHPRGNQMNKNITSNVIYPDFAHFGELSKTPLGEMKIA
jgi:hypothetical protein